LRVEDAPEKGSRGGTALQQRNSHRLFEWALHSKAYREDVVQVQAEIETARASSQSADFLAYQ
jgi:hypothetical protein